VFAVGPGPRDFVAARLDIEPERLVEDLQNLRERLRRDGDLAALKAEAARLGALLLKPAEKLIARADRLVVVPDGPLHLIPFAALIPPSASEYLVETKPIHVVSSATVFAELKKRRRPRPHVRLVAFGDPDYSAAPRTQVAFADRPDDRLSLLRGFDLHALPSARREVQELGRLFGQAASLFLGGDATEERAKAVAGEASMLHFACHGMLNEDAPLDSSLALSMPADWKPGRENGLLQAWEILEQVRIDADLVTLSACNSALGQDSSGEGLLGLTRAFQYAGARTLLASLWEVNDRSTAELMSRFYTHLRAGRTKDAALRAAQMEMIRGTTHAHPSRWAPFEVLGDWQ
jgi:CHAT domain-containing protein